MSTLFIRFISLFTLALIFCGGSITVADAQTAEKQVLSVTPPLFQLSVLPGDIWQSSIKVVNGNPYPLTVYAEVVNFSATGEAGQGRFETIRESGGDKVTLAEWINISPGPYTISPEQTEDIQFFVEVPKDANPGGHYAAILISTEPPEVQKEIAVRTSQVVTSLLFLRIEGDVHEEGTIREFRAVDSFLDVPDVTFSLRFENKGNVHLQPRGNITITNMWGTERGSIPINYQTKFGNVLPQSIRDFSLAWKSDFSITDVGRYKAVATLGYGESDIKNTTSTTYFWVIPVKWTLVTLLILVCFIALIVTMVRAYIRRVLALAGVRVPEKATKHDDESVPKHKSPLGHTYAHVSAPLRSGVLDLRTRITESEESLDVLTTIGRFVLGYKWFFLSLGALIAIFITITMYIGHATNAHKEYEVIITDGETPTVLDETEVAEILHE
jgi:hypothetical protein